MAAGHSHEVASSEGDLDRFGKSVYLPKEQPTQDLPTLNDRFLHLQIDLRRYGSSTSTEIRNRLADFMRRALKPFCDNVRQSEHGLVPTSITLQHRRRNEGCESPSIVIICDHRITKEVRQYFQSQPIKSLWHTHCPGLETPDFVPRIYHGTPRLISEAFYSLEGLGPDSNEFTMSGRLIRLGNSTDGRFTTLGGLLKVSWGKRFTIYGITAQNLALEDSLQEHSKLEEICCDEADEATIAGSNTNLCGFASSKTPSAASTTATVHDPFVNTVSDISPFAATRVGLQLASDWTGVQKGGPHQAIPRLMFPDHQWGHATGWDLVQIEDSSKLWPNLLLTASQTHELRLTNDMAFEEALGKDVYVISTTNKQRHGIISEVPSMTTLIDLQGTVETYDVKFTNGSDLQAQDSGSWVVDAKSHQVYGQVVVLATLQITYVVPIAKIVDRIKVTLGAASITFPTHEELDFCAFFPQPTPNLGSLDSYADTEEAYGQFETSQLEMWLEGNIDIPGVLPVTSSGTFISTSYDESNEPKNCAFNQSTQSNDDTLSETGQSHSQFVTIPRRASMVETVQGAEQSE